MVGVNAFVETEPSPLTADLEGSIQASDPAAEQAARASVEQWKVHRDEGAVSIALAQLCTDARSDTNLMPATLEAVRAGVTTGEWAGALRAVFGEYRAPTGVSGALGGTSSDPELAEVRAAVRRTGDELGSRLRVLIAKPGLDGHSNGAEQIAVRARDAGFEVVYQGIRLTPAEIVAAAVAEDVALVGISILSGSHMELVPSIVAGLRAEGLGDVPVVVGGIIPPADAARLAGGRGRGGLHAEGLRLEHHHGCVRRRDQGRSRAALTALIVARCAVV